MLAECFSCPQERFRAWRGEHGGLVPGLPAAAAVKALLLGHDNTPRLLLL
jgi:hypothetical protein